MSKTNIELGRFDASITFREDYSVEFNISDEKPEDLMSKNIELALTIYYLLISKDPELLEFIERERQKTKKILTESHEKPVTIN